MIDIKEDYRFFDKKLASHKNVYDRVKITKHNIFSKL